jgi:hypothetical protein
MLEIASSGTTSWSAGLRLSGRRELSSEERREVERLAGEFRRRAFRLLLPGPLLFLTCVLLFGLLPDLELRWTLLVFCAVGLPLLAGLPLGLAARTWFRAARALLEDARTGFTDQFAGNARELPGRNGTLDRLVREGLQVGAGEPQSFEVLPRSGVVWQVNGSRPGRPIIAARAEVADLPPYAAIAAEWTEPAGAGPGSIHLGNRELSPPERDEVERHRRRLAFRAVPAGVALTGWFLTALVTNSWPDAVDTAALLALMVLANLYTARCLRLGLRLARDAAIGRAVIVRSPLPPPATGEGPSGLAAPQEFLPGSGLLWSNAGIPAAWRLATLW